LIQLFFIFFHRTFFNIVRRQNEGSFGSEAVARAVGQPNVPNVRWAYIFFVFMQQKFIFYSVVGFVFLQ